MDRKNKMQEKGSVPTFIWIIIPLVLLGVMVLVVVACVLFCHLMLEKINKQKLPAKQNPKTQLFKNFK